MSTKWNSSVCSCTHRKLKQTPPWSCQGSALCPGTFQPFPMRPSADSGPRHFHTTRDSPDARAHTPSNTHTCILNTLMTTSWSLATTCSCGAESEDIFIFYFLRTPLGCNGGHPCPERVQHEPEPRGGRDDYQSGHSQVSLSKTQTHLWLKSFLLFAFLCNDSRFP